MENVNQLVVQVQQLPDGDDEELSELTQQLRAQLLELDVDSVDLVAGTSPPAARRAWKPSSAGWLSGSGKKDCGR
jgi:hypothetical protein